MCCCAATCLHAHAPPSLAPLLNARSQEAADSGHVGSGGGEDDEEYAEVAPPGRPLSWFGTLVAPSLRQAEAHFGEALSLAVQAADAQRRLRQGVDAWRAAGPAVDCAAASQA